MRLNPPKYPGGTNAVLRITKQNIKGGEVRLWFNKSVTSVEACHRDPIVLQPGGNQGENGNIILRLIQDLNCLQGPVLLIAMVIHLLVGTFY